MVGVDPPSGTSGVGLSGPFKFQFDKRIIGSLQQNQGVIVNALPGYVDDYYASLTVSDDGTTLFVRVSSSGFPTAYDITVDPTRFVDPYGNPGEGPTVTVHYTTFVTTDSSGPHLKASLPADGDTGVPTNVQPRLLFDKRVNNGTERNGIELQANGVPIEFSFAFSYDSSGATSVVSIIPSKLLAPNSTYTIVIKPALTDTNGFRVQQLQTIQFTTGSGPDVIAPKVLAYSPGVQQGPPNTRIFIRTNKPIASIVCDRLAQVGLARGQSAANPVPVAVTLSSDGTLLTLIPQAPLAQDWYTVRTSEIIDTSGAVFFPSSTSYGAISFGVTGNSDQSAPALLAVSPPADTTSVPLSTTIQFRLNRVCGTCLFPGVVGVSANGSAIPAKVSADYGVEDTEFSVIANGGSLSASTTYTVLLTGIMDLAGNVMPDYAFSFTTASVVTPAPALRLLDSSLVDGDTGVNPTGPFTFHYDSVLNPVSATIALSDLSGFYYPARASASGGSLSVIPLTALPANTTFHLSYSVSAVSGAYSSAKISFTTVTSDDTTPPRVISISPSDGAVLQPGAGPFTLTFSKPINPSTITANGISVYSAQGPLNPSFTRSEDSRSVSLALGALPTGAFTIIASCAVKDLSGNSLITFESNYQVRAAVSGRTSIREMRPAAGSTGVPANTLITWFLDQPADLGAIQSNLVVLVDNTPFPGSFDLLGDGGILRFTPTTPFPAGSWVSFYERTSLLGINQYSIAGFTIASNPDTTLRFVRTTMGSSALDSVFEVEFTQDPPLGQNIAALSYSTGNGYSVPVPFTESIPRAHVLRLTTTGPRKPGYYGIALSNKVIRDFNVPGYLNSTINSALLGGTPTVASVGPVRDATAVYLNASVRILFGAPINPLTVTPLSATLSIGGRVLTVERLYPSNSREIVLRPLEAFPPNSQIDVRLTGLEDLAGRAIPTASWSFSTGADVDFSGPSLLSTFMPYSNSGVVEVGSGDVLRLVFSEPIDPGITAEVVYFNSGWLSNAATFTLSSDLRVLTIAPVHAWAIGQEYSVNLQHLLDLCGNTSSGSFSLTFKVPFDSSVAPPRLQAISPPDAGTAMPLNAQIMAAFDKPVFVPPDGIQLTDADGNSVALTPAYSLDPAVAIFAPETALRPNTTYRLTLSSAFDMSGNAMSSPANASFTTGEVPDYTSPTRNIAFISPLPAKMPLRIAFDEPISPAWVTSRSIQLLMGNAPQAADIVLSADRRNITVNPRLPLVPGRAYTLNVYRVTDFAGNAAASGRTDFVAGDSPDTTLPTITIFPPDGTTGFPVSGWSYSNSMPSLRATFSKPADLIASPPTMRVLKDGKPIAGKVATGDTGLTFTPAAALEHNVMYRIEVANVVDYLGNAAPAASSAFATSGSADDDRAPFRVTSIEPADGSVGITNDSPIILTFTKLLDSSAAWVQVATSSLLPVYGHWSVNGSTLTFTPNDPWPSAATITVTVSRRGYGMYFTDLSGVILDKDYRFSFKTSVRPDPTPPELLSITPAAGTPLSPINTTFTLVFSKPIILDSQALQAFNGSQPATPAAGYSGQSLRTITVTALVGADTVFTLIGTTGIHDDAGNSITPFSFQYPTLKTDESGYPTVVSVSPRNYAQNVAVNTPIKIQFSKAMDPISLLAGVRVTENGNLLTGQLQALDANHSVQFTPDSPYHAGSEVDVFVLTTAADSSGYRLSGEYQSRFLVAGTSGQAVIAQPMSVSIVGFGDAVAPGAALDLSFDHELDASTVSEQNVWLRLAQTRVPGTVTLRDKHTIHFQPAEPLRVSGRYVLTAGPDLRSKGGLSNEAREFSFGVDQATPEVRVDSVEYVRDPAPLAVRIRFSGPVSGISTDRLQLVASDGSVVHASGLLRSTDGREWLVTLPSNQPVRVVLDGIEDRWGRLLPGESREPLPLRTNEMAQ